MSPTSQEPPAGGPDDEHPDAFGDDADTELRGWIHPDDRLWRHPSELGRELAPASFPEVDGAAVDRRARIMLAIGAAAAVAAAIWTVILLSPASERPPTAVQDGSLTDSPMTTLARQVYALPTVADSASLAMVQLRVMTAHGALIKTGVAVAEGGLVATTADGLEGIRNLQMVEPGGHVLRASLVGMDAGSDVALVSVPADLPVAPFADDEGLTPGAPDMTLSMVGTSTGTPTGLQCTPGVVTSVALPIGAGPATGMGSITSSATASGTQQGDPLLDDTGSVVGLLYNETSTGPTYLPAQLVLGVADDLRSNGKVLHGWLGVDGGNQPDEAGAAITGVVANGPAAGLLHPGDVITAIGSYPVRSMAELRDRLYVLPPQTTIVLSVVDGSLSRAVEVTLSASP